MKVHCNSCNQPTFHWVEGKHSHEYKGGYESSHCYISHAVIKCKGCEQVSFRHEYHDIENGFPDQFGEWEVPVYAESYPKPSKIRIKTHLLPRIVNSIFGESCAAYRDSAYTLAGIGFRATIEAICNDQKIAGNDLGTKITNLLSKGWISQIESERLHSIRFLGNDAAHKIVRPTEESLEAALIIVEHLLNTIYILDKESKGKLKERIDKYEDFEGLLLEKIDNYGDGDIVCLKEILGRETNLLKGSIKSFEEILRANIGKKQFKRLGFSDFKGAKEKQDLQHYKVISPHPPN